MECAFGEGKRWLAGAATKKEQSRRARREGRSFLIALQRGPKRRGGSKPQAGGVVRSRGEMPTGLESGEKSSEKEEKPFLR